MRNLYILIICLFFFVQGAVAATYYVDVTGSDGSGDGSAGKPWRTLRYAVSKVPANQGHVIKLSAGTFVEAGLIEVPPGVSVEGAGKDATILKANSAFYYYPASPSYATDKFLISLSGYNYANGNQSLKNFTINGDGKKLHGGIYVHYRTNVLIQGVKVTGTNFTGIWLWDVKDSRVTQTDLINCSWGSTSYQVGALNIGNLERVEIDNCYIDEDTGYGIKAIGPSGYNNILHTKIHDCTVTVNPTGLWNNGSAPNIAIELWQVDPVGCEIYNCYIDNTVSLINANNNPSTGVQTIRVHHNTIDLASRANGSGYAIELTMHDAEIDHNYIIKGSYGIANWDNPMKNWKIHHNTFYGLGGAYPGEIVRSQWSGLHNVDFFNNTIEFAGTKTMNLIGAYGGSSDNINLKNNLVINNNTSYSYYQNQLIHLENGATMNSLNVSNNLLFNIPVGSVPGTYSNNLSGDPMVTKTGNRPDPYYTPGQGSPLVDAGLNLGSPYQGSAPDIGAHEYAGTASNQPPAVSITSPANNATFAAGSNITINATATDTDGKIAKVEFFNGSTKLGEDNTSPYSFTWNAVAAGTYSLTAKATDDDAAAKTSTAVSVTANATNAAPAVSITSPSNNATFAAGSNITINANATDSDGKIAKVEFFNGSTKLGEDNTSPYSFTWNAVAAGSYSLTAKATDDDDAVKTSGAISVTVNATNAAPAVSITSPSNNATFAAGSNITINANATDSDGKIAKVEFFNGSTKLGEDNTSPYSFTWNAVAAGTYSLTAKDTDDDDAVKTSGAVSVTVNATNTAPAVSITSPSNNATFAAGSNITINANATDSDGKIAKVEFFNGTTKLGEDNTSPYSFTWNAVAAGSYSLTAKATDDDDAVKTSGAISVTVNATNAAPAVSITSPANNDAFTAGSNITINANATDADGKIAKVEFFNGTTKLGEDNTSPYSFTWNAVAAGTYSLTAKATDDDDAVKTSGAVSVTVNATNTAPAVSITSPANNDAFTAGSNITINANATDSDGKIAKVEFFNGSTKLGEDNTSPYSFVWNAVAAGTYSLTAKATDDNDAVKTSAAVSVTVNATNAAPAVSITSPSNNASFAAGSNITINANATDSDGKIAKVEFFNGTTKLGEDNTSPYSFTWNGVAAGSYSLTAKATDDDDAVKTSGAVSVTVNATNAAPAVSITSPANNDAFTAGSNITINATATDSDGKIAKVEFFNGTTKLGEDNTSPYSFTWNAVAAGTYSLTAKATDDDDAVKTSGAVSVTVNATNAAPAVSITSPANNDAFTAGSNITINANATDSDGKIAKVEFFNGTTKLGEDNTSPYSFTWNAVAAGAYSLTAKATDDDDAVKTSGAVSVTVNATNTAPAVSITSPANNDTFTAGSNITINANATDTGGKISKVEFFNGSTKLGEDNTSPYDHTWSNIPAGTHRLTARATDNQGAVTSSVAVSVTVNVAGSEPAIHLGLYANDAALAGRMELTPDATASKGSYFSMPAGSGTNHFIPPASHAEFNFDLEKTDRYVVWARVKTPTQSNQGFHVYDGKGKWTTWLAGVHTSWTWVKVTDAYTHAAVLFPFTEGRNHLRMAWYHEKAQVDRILITNDRTFVPEDESTPPPSDTAVKLGLYAVDATLSGGMELTSDATALKGSYFSMPKGSGENYYIPPSANAQFNFELPEAGEYVVWARVKSPSENRQGYHIYDGKGKWTTWMAGINTEWTWVKMTVEQTSEPIIFSFSAGLNTLMMGWYQEGVQVDAIMITNDQNFVPTEKNDTSAARSAVSTSETVEGMPMVSVYPNPVKDIVTVGVNSDIAQKAVVSIRSATTLDERKLVLSLVPGENSVQVDMSDVDKGLYLVTVRTSTGKTTRTKLMVTH